ncbi:hypothetical protein HUG15_15365 [Salicibibacter cibarius]|uniref:Uncharacterized protein n=1 Tax=Salicibibacter cibarius TaxID=2743000 RepID=A0A7T7CCE7_9BACI|nr:hypothetical protein HUG15_15365 [Salicibibacter cibarius]
MNGVADGHSIDRLGHLEAVGQLIASWRPKKRASLVFGRHNHFMTTVMA